MSEINYDALKKRGFLKQKQEGFFILRTRSQAGNYSAKELLALYEISEKYGKGIVHASTRQGLEIPFIKFKEIEKIERELQAKGVLTGTSGPRIRTTTACPGNNWCKRGLVNTFAFFDKIEKELNIKCSDGAPHKFKIAISGCPNKCTRAQASEIGIHGQVDTSGPERRIGYTVYLGGCGGITPRAGIKLDKIFTEEQALSIVKNVVLFYKNHAKPRQRLALLIEEIGKDTFLKKVAEIS